MSKGSRIKMSDNKEKSCGREKHQITAACNHTSTSQFTFTVTHDTERNLVPKTSTKLKHPAITQITIKIHSNCNREQKEKKSSGREKYLVHS